MGKATTPRESHNESYEENLAKRIKIIEQQLTLIEENKETIAEKAKQRHDMYVNAVETAEDYYAKIPEDLKGNCDTFVTYVKTFMSDFKILFPEDERTINAMARFMSEKFLFLQPNKTDGAMHESFLSGLLKITGFRRNTDVGFFTYVDILPQEDLISAADLLVGFHLGKIPIKEKIHLKSKKSFIRNGGMISGVISEDREAMIRFMRSFDDTEDDGSNSGNEDHEFGRAKRNPGRPKNTEKPKSREIAKCVQHGLFFDGQVLRNKCNRRNQYIIVRMQKKDPLKPRFFGRMGTYSNLKEYIKAESQFEGKKDEWRSVSLKVRSGGWAPLAKIYDRFVPKEKA